MKKGIYVLPNLFTTATLFAGFYSLIASMNEKFVPASVVILIAWVLDGMDGRMARMTNTTSKFGAEYDSLADIVAFGIAPAILVYVLALSSFGKWGWMVAFLFIACGALRLARFNVQMNVMDRSLFNGLPIPGAAIVIASTIILFYHIGIQDRLINLASLFFVAALSFLMVSNVKYYSFKDLNYFTRKPFISFVLIVVIMLIVVAEPQITIFTFAIGYAFSGPIWFLVMLARKKKNPIIKRDEENIERNLKVL
jgi:CDP-diacylglycerol--serine O-phosphatidyltransferase